MKKTLKLGTVAVLVALGAAQASAATNWVANVNFSLSIYIQGASTTNATTQTSQIITRHVINRDLIGKILPTASPLAKLILKADVNAGNGPTFFVRDNGIDTDVSTNLQAQVSDTMVTAFTKSLATGKKSEMQKFIVTINFDNQTGVSFSVNGLATLRQNTLVDSHLGNLGEVPVGLTAQVAGTGNDTEDDWPADTHFTLNGTMTVTSGKIETN